METFTKTKSEYNLADILENAANSNLEQVKFKKGNAISRKACAIGSVRYFISNGTTVDYFKMTKDQQKQYDKMLGKGKWKELVLITLNDLFGMKFDRIAEFCRKWNL